MLTNMASPDVSNSSGVVQLNKATNDFLPQRKNMQQYEGGEDESEDNIKTEERLTTERKLLTQPNEENKHRRSESNDSSKLFKGPRVSDEDMQEVLDLQNSKI